MAVRIKCPSCEVMFRWEIAELGWPRFCPLCSYDTAPPDENELAAPYIGKLHNHTADRLYRQMEEGAQARAERAGQMFGESASETGLQMTNLKDNMREGDIAEMPVNNPASQMIDQAPGMFGHQPQAGMAFSAQVGQGLYANAGVRAQQAVREHHSQYPDHTSDRPALEISSPAYQRRV